ncbi:relaxase domain-containing protein [Glaciecola sp. MH2013]|uniref:MobF family relaxase n=1 Tax=Glaciecola sp. MH2013 TaxID=2785524 RepID=UPI00189CEC5E|nr:MobF family relaxase [Glaciecola sp. MH2013]MBF7074309.1 relaxase domain-containing protein [Glaciecola sp. MH2013]
MMTIAGIKNIGYYQDLATEDYYVKGGEPPGIWAGIGATELKLQGIIEDKDFANVMQGYSPDKKTALCQAPGANHRPGWDLTFNAPKSVSVLWARADERTRVMLQEAQKKAVLTALRLIEDNAAFTRRGSAGSKFEAVEGLVAGLFEHSTSRAQDPHLHTHMVIANTAPRADGTWGTIESRSIMLWQKAASSVYRASLAESIRALGYQIAKDKEAFYVVGVPEAKCKQLSKRSELIKTELAKHSKSNCRSKSADIIALNTRERKSVIDRSSLFSSWALEMDEMGFDENALNRIYSAEHDFSPNEIDIPILDEETVKDLLTERMSTFRAQDAYELASKLAIENRGSAHCAVAVASRVLETDHSIFLCRDWKNNALYTTIEVIETERSMKRLAIELCSNSFNDMPPAAIDFAISNMSIELSAEQLESVFAACSNSQLSIIQGSAGAGKSVSMRCVAKAYKSTGSNVMGATIARAAANNLQSEAKIQTHTIARLLHALDSKTKPLNKGDVLIVDEAGQVGTKYLEKILSHAAEIGFKVVLVGEDKQLDAIEHGGVLRYLSQPEIVGTTRVETIRRQTNSWDRQAVADFRDGYASQALTQYAKRLQLNFSNDEDSTKQSLISAWQTYRMHNPDKKSMVIAQSWNDVLQLNRSMRHELQNEGVVGHENIEVKGVVSDREIEFQVSVGERIRFTKNDYKRNYTNGDFGTVTKVQQMDDGDVWIRINMDTGRQTQFMLSDYCNDDGRTYLTQAYAQTVYSSQGLTIDGDVFIYYTKYMDRAHSYVACSRHKDKAHIFANAEELKDLIPSDFEHAPVEIGLREALAAQMSRDSRPKLAIEYLEQRQANELSESKEKVIAKTELEIF